MLEGVAYDEFVVPNCRECLAEERINSVVGVEIPVSSSLTSTPPS